MGIPRGLGFFEYYPLWRGFLEGLGAEVVVSPPTNRAILDRGVKAAVEETCLPVKVYFGHAMELAPRVDFLFVPRLVSVEPRLYTCPKFLGLPEMVKACAGALPPVIDVTCNENRRSGRLSSALGEAAARLGAGRARFRRALGRGRAHQACFQALLSAGWERSRALAALPGRDPVVQSPPQEAQSQQQVMQSPPQPAPAGRHPGPEAPSPDGRVRIAVLGHPYLLHDRHLSLNLLGRLDGLGADTVTGDALPEGPVLDAADSLPKKIFWTFARRTMGGGLYFLERGGVDGIIHVVAFGCGSDALICDLLERFSRRRGRLPFMLLTLDEHSGEAGLVTRLEAFLDMIRRRRPR